MSLAIEQAIPKVSAKIFLACALIEKNVKNCHFLNFSDVTLFLLFLFSQTLFHSFDNVLIMNQPNFVTIRSLSYAPSDLTYYIFVVGYNLLLTNHF